MREVSPHVRYTVDEVLKFHASESDKALLEVVRSQKLAGVRPRPSATMDHELSQQLDAAGRAALADRIAELVDETMYGRAGMGAEVNTLLVHALDKVGIKSRLAVGNALYLNKGVEVFRWQYIWVRAGKEVIDLNIDVSAEHPDFPKRLTLRPYWGPVDKVPRDRKLLEDKMAHYMADDFDKHTGMWWKDLEPWIAESFANRKFRAGAAGGAAPSA